MLILFDFENIQNFHYKKVKAFLIEEFGKRHGKTPQRLALSVMRMLIPAYLIGTLQ